MIKQIVDLVTRRPQRQFEVESSRIDLDEVSEPVYKRVLDELAQLESLMKEKRDAPPH